MDFNERFEALSGERRLWMLVPEKKDAYVPGFEGTFLEALASAAGSAAYWGTAYSIYEADPKYYRHQGGLKKLWAVVKAPVGSPLRGAHS